MKRFSVFTILGFLCVFLFVSCAQVRFDSAETEELFSLWMGNSGKPPDVSVLRVVQKHEVEKCTSTATFYRYGKNKAEIIGVYDNGGGIFNHYLYTPDGNSRYNVKSLNGSGDLMYIKASLMDSLKTMFVFTDGMLWGFGDAVKEVSSDKTEHTRSIFKKVGAPDDGSIKYIKCRFKKDYPIRELTLAVDKVTGDLRGAVAYTGGAFFYSDFSIESGNIRLPHRITTNDSSDMLTWEINPSDELKKASSKIRDK